MVRQLPGQGGTEEFHRQVRVIGPPLPQVEHPLTQAHYPAKRSEQAGMTGDPAHQPAVFIMHFPLQHPAPPWAVLGGRDAVFLDWQRVVNGQEKEIRGKAQPFRYLLPQERRQRPPGEVFHQVAEEHIPKIAVAAFAAWWIHERLRHNSFE